MDDETPALYTGVDTAAAGQRLDVLDMQKVWSDARIKRVAVDGAPEMAEVHYM